MCADRSQHPIVHFVGSIPLPDSETVFRTLSQGGRAASRRACPTARPASARPGSASCRTCSPSNPAIEVASDVPPFKFTQWDGKVVREIPRLRVKPGATLDPATLRHRLCRHGDRVVGAVRAAAEGRRHSRPASNSRSRMPTPIAPTYNNMVPADRPKHAAGADAAFHRRGREDRRRRCPTTASRSNGTSARRCWPGRAITTRARSISAPRRSTC